MRSLGVALLFAATGCAQLFGIDETTGGSDPTRVSLTMQRWSVGASVSKNPQDMSKEMGTFLVDDGAGGFTKLAAEHSAADELSAALDTGTPPILFSLPDQTPFQRLWATPNRDRRGVFAAFEHANALAPMPNSEIMLSATLPSGYASNESFRIEAVGAWMAYGLTAANLPAPDLVNTAISAMIPFMSFAKMTSFPAAAITSQDVVVFERYVGNQLTGVYQAPPFDQTDGPDPITANVVGVPANKPLTAMIMPSTYSQRFSAVRPAVGALSQSWVVRAAPGWSIGSITGPLLYAGTPAATDTMIMTMFGNPFESLDWRSLLQYVAQENLTYMFMGTLALGLSAQLYVVAEPTGTLNFDMPAGLPINIRANQTPLSTDGMMVMLDPAKPVEVDAITDKPAATVYFVALYEVTMSADGMAAERHLLVDAVTTGEPKVKFPRDLFQTDHFYYFDFRTMQGGYLQAAMGDLQTLTLPYQVSRADSAVFQVVAQ
ncbi:MAG TPA: hypothetical protein VFV99_21120 [Kofleriaceae bacterium]|nr:hypothetical protein [Kofleriaceae bacterium]